MKTILNKIFSLKFTVSILLTVSFAALLRLFYLQLLDLTLSLEKLDFTNLSFCSIVAIFKSVLCIVLDEFFPHTLHMNSGNNFLNDKNSTVLLMEDKNTKSSKSVPSSLDLEQLSKDLSNTLSNMWYTLGDLQKIKESKNISLFVSKKDNLSIDVPITMSDQEASEISSKVLTLDRAYNEKLDHYKELLEKDKNLNNIIGPSYNELYKKVTDRHKDVFKNK